VTAVRQEAGWSDDEDEVDEMGLANSYIVHELL